VTRSCLAALLLLAPLAACGPSYSPNTYASNAAQQANKADQGIIIGVRPVFISAAGTTGTVTGGAAGGIAGAQVGVGPVSAFSALGGSLLGGIAGNAVEHASDDTTAYEYIVKKTTGELVSVTQKDAKPLALGLKVLVIAGPQARVVQDYTDPALAQTIKAKPDDKTKTDDTKPADTPAAAPPSANAPATNSPTASPASDKPAAPPTESL
jgi:outer membrane lipoprotein SlyB